MDWTVFVCVILTNIISLQALDVSETAKKLASTLTQDLFPVESGGPQSPKLLSIINIITMMVPNNTSDNRGVDCAPGDESCEDKTRTDKKRSYQKIFKRRNFNHHPGHDVILGVPQYPEDLPAAEPILPGHTLLRPSKGMLKSAVKFPLRDFGGAIYGNLDNVGITLGKTNQHIRYSDFRKANWLKEALLNAVRRSKMNDRERSRPMIIIEIDPKRLGINNGALNNLIHNQASEEENSASEVSDVFNPMQRARENNNVLYGIRRSPIQSKTKFRDRSKYYLRDKNDGYSDSNESSEEEQEKNPGNPYTIHKNKYKQNWLWNHKMDGDHMNLSPYAPEFQAMGPTGNQLFFGRKWWYFNQDDYKPMRRR